MKKTILLAMILSMFMGTSAYALATYKWEQLDNFTVLQNNHTDGENVKVSSFTRASTTCYMLTSKPATPSEATNVSISCVK